MPRAIAIASLLVLGAGLPAQQASYSFFGPDCAQAPFTPRTLPKVGASFAIQFQKAYPPWVVPSDVIVLTGFSNTTYGPFALPFQTAVLSGGGTVFMGPLLVGFVDVRPSFAVGGSGLVNYQIPSDPTLVGVTFFQQLLTLAILPRDLGYLLDPCAGRGVIGN